jgi:hypothetical protein
MDTAITDVQNIIDQAKYAKVYALLSLGLLVYIAAKVK